MADKRAIDSEQTLTISRTMVVIIALSGIFIGGLVAALQISKGNMQEAWYCLVFVACNVLALPLIKADLHKGTIFLLVCTLLATILLNIVNFGTGPGLYILVPGLLACVCAITKKRFSAISMFVFTGMMVSVLWISYNYWPDQYAQRFESVNHRYPFVLTISLFLSVFMIYGAMKALKSTYLKTQAELIAQEGRVSELHAQVCQSLSQKSDALELTLRIQEIGAVYGYCYYPETDELYSPDRNSEDYFISSLEESNIQYRSEYGQDSPIVNFIVESLNKKKGWDSEIEVEHPERGRSVLQVKGELNIIDGKIEKIIIVIKDITNTKALTDQLSRRANYDDLTDLINRRYFEEVFSKIYQRAEGSVANSVYLFIDLDRFKIVNDTSGHQAGDQLLYEVSQLMKESVRANDYVGRLGGDEFGIILDGCDAEQAITIAENIRQNIEAYRIIWDAIPHRVEASIGVVSIDPALGSIEDIQALADAACYRAKNNGRNCVESVFGNESSFRSVNTEKLWVSQIDRALDEGRFSLWYQDIVAAKGDSQKIPRREVLLRLNDPQKSEPVLPLEFLAIAERYNRSTQIDEWVVCELIRFLTSGQVPEDRREYWINLSAQSIGDLRFVKTVYQKIKDSGLAPGTINFEITETSAISNIDAARKMMGQLQEIGCQFALDDFGAGHASFGYLRMLPVSCVKIDEMFIRNVATDDVDRIFSKSIVDIAHAFDMTVIAEYVENKETVDVLESIEVDYLQGFFFSVPKPLDSIIRSSDSKKRA